MQDERKPLVLIVDRDLGTLTRLDALLSREGYRVTTCYSSEEALNDVAGRCVDLVITGVGGSERSGAPLGGRIKVASPGTSVLVLGESDDETSVAEALAAGADGILRRSTSESQILQRVERLLHAPQAT